MRNLGLSIMLGSALVGLLLLPAAAEAGKAPSLASTSQYKAFIAYVKKLDGMVGQPIPAVRKETFEAELSAKKEAASHKANALFKRASEEVQAETDAKAREQTTAVRRAEEESLDELSSEYRSKIESATGEYQGKVENAEAGRIKVEDRAHEQIGVLRGKKAKSRNKDQKAVIQKHIAGKIAEIQAKREATKEKRSQAKSAFAGQKEELHAAEASKETAIGEEAEATVEKIAKHWKKAFNDKKETLSAKRESQLAYLFSKLEKGRADIAAMTVSG